MKRSNLHCIAPSSELLYSSFEFANCIYQKCNSSNCKKYLSTASELQCSARIGICKKHFIKLYLSKLHYVFVPISRCICPNNKIYLSITIELQCSGRVGICENQFWEPTTLQRPSVDARWTTRESFLKRAHVSVHPWFEKSLSRLDQKKSFFLSFLHTMNY